MPATPDSNDRDFGFYPQRTQRHRDNHQYVVLFPPPCPLWLILLSFLHAPTRGFASCAPGVVHARIRQRKVPTLRSHTPRPCRQKVGGEDPAQAFTRGKGRSAFHDLGARGISERQQPRISSAPRQHAQISPWFVCHDGALGPAVSLPQPASRGGRVAQSPAA